MHRQYVLVFEAQVVLLQSFGSIKMCTVEMLSVTFDH